MINDHKLWKFNLKLANKNQSLATKLLEPTNDIQSVFTFTTPKTQSMKVS